MEERDDKRHGVGLTEPEVATSDWAALVRHVQERPKLYIGAVVFVLAVLGALVVSTIDNVLRRRIMPTPFGSRIRRNVRLLSPQSPSRARSLPRARSISKENPRWTTAILLRHARHFRSCATDFPSSNLFRMRSRALDSSRKIRVILPMRA